MKKPLTIGIAGPSGSGKTSIAEHIIQNFSCPIAYLRMDYYYKDQSHLSKSERAAINYDSPDAFDTELMAEHLNELIQHQTIKVPRYDYTTHTRLQNAYPQDSTPIVLVEGIILFAIDSLCEKLDIRLFLDTPADICLMRRIRRDCQQRGRTTESVIKQYENSVRPMMYQYIYPSKTKANHVVQDGGFESSAIPWLTQRMAEHIDA
ncbi:uridine kinase [Gammaproteobacteria bacterium]|jgi:uridine kinase|nr:uridine kinase [Gammaproteobacteria bacterium]